MIWVDKAKFDEMTYQMPHTTANATASVGATTVDLTDASDFASSGSFYHRTNATAVAYTGKSGNTLTGVTTLITPVVAGVEVFQNPTLGLPQYWTAFGGYAYHYPNTGATYNNRNYYMDFYKSQTTITTDVDEIVLPDPTIVQYYLEWKFLKKLNNGVENEGSISAKISHEQRKAILKIKDNPNRTFRLKPRLNQINENGSNSTQRERLGNFTDI